MKVSKEGRKVKLSAAYLAYGFDGTGNNFD